MFKELEKVHQDYPGTEVEVLAVISKASVRRLSTFHQQFNTSFTVLADPDFTFRSRIYGVRSNPTIVIIDKKGIARHMGGFATWKVMEDMIESVRASDGPQEGEE